MPLPPSMLNVHWSRGVLGVGLADSTGKPFQGTGRVEPSNLLFAGVATGSKEGGVLMDHIHEIEKMRRAAAIYRSAPEYSALDTFLERLKEMIESRELGVLRE